MNWNSNCGPIVKGPMSNTNEPPKDGEWISFEVKGEHVNFDYLEECGFQRYAKNDLDHIKVKNTTDESLESFHILKIEIHLYLEDLEEWKRFDYDLPYLEEKYMYETTFKIITKPSIRKELLPKFL